MTLSTSRQQFLAYESHAPDEIQYGRRGGIFISTCICISFILLAVIAAVLVGIIVYFITYFKLAQTRGDFWDENEPFGQISAPAPDLRLPPHVVPSYYRLKLKTDLEKSIFTGNISITIKASKRVKEIILHSKSLSINQNAKLTEQIYQKVETLHMPSRKKRDTVPEGNSTSNPTEISLNTTSEGNLSTTGDPITVVNNNATVTEMTITAETTPNTEIVSEGTVVEASTTTQPKEPMPTPVDTQVVHSNVRNIKIISITHTSGDRLVLTLASALKPDVDYTLELSFDGNISNALTGFYKSSYSNAKGEIKELGVTQFEPTSARAAFPCFDEPAFKAKFEISIAHPKNISVLSNMKIASTDEHSDGWQWTHFERSVSMSTYLVAYVLSDFQSLETNYMSTDNITKVIKVWTRPELIHKAKYALAITPKILRFYEDVFGVPYALDKVDLVAIPDFSSGAMENWGLVTFRETTLLFDEAEGHARDKQNVAIDIAHELAHQWFGNLVTMSWWTDLWLNEGFATYIEYVGVNHIEPGWAMLESFTRDKMDLLRSDALKNTSPVSREVFDTGEISQKFDEISYSKGASLIRMLNHTITAEVFHKGLLNYLENWKYKNADENDLWAAMSISGPSLVDFMNTWTRQAGYPLLTVKRNYTSGQVEFRQNIFTTAKEPSPALKNQLWQIPVSYTSMDTPVETWTTQPQLWVKQRAVMKDIKINETQALYVNVEAIGYYRVNYDSKNWELLSKAIKSGDLKVPIAKAQLIDDAFNLAKLGLLNYSLALDLTTCVIDGEDAKIVWDLLLNNMAFLRYNLKASSGYVYFQDYIRTLLDKQLKKLNYGLSKPKDDIEAFLIENLVMWECIVESPRCLDWCKSEMNKWMAEPDFSNNPIPSYLRSLVYNVAIKYGSRREFDFLWRVFTNTTDPNIKSVIISALPSTREEALITMLLEKSLNEIPKQYAVAVWNVEAPIGTRLAQDYLLNNFDKIYYTFTEMDSFMFPAVLSGAFGAINSEEELTKFKTFALRHREKLMPMSQTLQKIVDTGNLRIGWRKYIPAINDWVKNFVTGSNSPVNGTTEPPPTTTATPASSTEMTKPTELSNSTSTEAPSPADVSTVTSTAAPDVSVTVPS